MIIHALEKLYTTILRASFDEYAVICISLLIAAIGFILAHRYIPRLRRGIIPAKLASRGIPFVAPFLFGIGLLVGEFILEHNNTRIYLLPALQTLTLAWLAAELTLLVFSKKLSLFLIVCAVIPVTTLHMLGYWKPFIVFLQKITFGIGAVQLTLYHVASSIVTIAFLLWFSGWVLHFSELRIKRIRGLRSSSRALIAKTIQVFIYIVIALMILDTLEIDLTTLAVFSGALGVGLGFGLQKIASNFISGIILLFEKSIETGHLVELSDGTTGFIKETSARYTLLETYDTREIFIPNEEFINQRVTNWTFSNTSGRIEISVGVSYSADISKAQEIILDAAKSHPRCIADPEPRCFLRNFGDSSVDFLLYFWVEDVREGRFAVQSDVLFSIWNGFKRHNIEIPFPQRDLHIKEPVLVKTVKER